MQQPKAGSQLERIMPLHGINIDMQQRLIQHHDDPMQYSVGKDMRHDEPGIRAVHAGSHRTNTNAETIAHLHQRNVLMPRIACNADNACIVRLLLACAGHRCAYGKSPCSHEPARKLIHMLGSLQPSVGSEVCAICSA